MFLESSDLGHDATFQMDKDRAQRVKLPPVRFSRAAWWLGTRSGNSAIILLDLEIVANQFA
jgi:hypothetical protein